MSSLTNRWTLVCFMQQGVRFTQMWFFAGTDLITHRQRETERDRERQRDRQRETERQTERDRERESIFEFNNILIMVEKDVVLINTVKATLLQHKLPVTIVLHTQNKKCCPKHFVKELF